MLMPTKRQATNAKALSRKIHKPVRAAERAAARAHLISLNERCFVDVDTWDLHPQNVKILEHAVDTFIRVYAQGYVPTSCRWAISDEIKYGTQ